MACNQKPKTSKEIYDEKMETYTDEQLLEEYYGTPQNYRVGSVNLQSSCSSNDLKITPVIKSGAVVQVMFNKGKVYVSGIGTLLGSYSEAYYANEDGSITAKIKSSLGSFADLPNGDKRYHPSHQSKYITVTTKREYVSDNGWQKCIVTINYILQTLEKAY